MKFPKEIATTFVDIDGECIQINLHKGRVYNYWFIEPSSRPIKEKKGIFPKILKNLDLSRLGDF